MTTKKKPAPKKVTKKPAKVVLPVAAVQLVLASKSYPMGLAEVARRSKKDKPRVQAALQAMRAAGKVRMTGKARAAVYLLVSTDGVTLIPRVAEALGVHTQLRSTVISQAVVNTPSAGFAA